MTRATTNNSVCVFTQLSPRRRRRLQGTTRRVKSREGKTSRGVESRRDDNDDNDDYYDDEKNTFQLRLAPRTMAQGEDSYDDDDERRRRVKSRSSRRLRCRTREDGSNDDKTVCVSLHNCYMSMTQTTTTTRTTRRVESRKKRRQKASSRTGRRRRRRRQK
jgi:hypothetical protein